MAHSPHVPHLVSEGGYYLKKRVSIAIDDGLVGIPVGSEVKKISENGGKWLVEYKGNSTEINPQDVTSDSDEIDEILAGHAKAARALAEARAARKSELKAQQAAPTPRSNSPEEDEARYAKIAALREQIDRRWEKIAILRSKEQKSRAMYPNRISAYQPVITRIENEINALQKRIDSL